MSKEKIHFFTALEIGSSKVAMALARLAGEKMEIVAVSQVPHKGMHQGNIVDAQEIHSAIRKAKSEIEATADCSVENVYVSVADLFLETVHSKGMITLKKNVTAKDVSAVVKSAQDMVQIRSDREILHMEPQFFKIAGTKHIEAPIGQKGPSLEVHAAAVVGSKKLLQTIRESAALAELNVVEFVALPLASSMALLSKEERESGIALVDIGATITHITAYKAGALLHSFALQVGGANFTNDLAVGLRTPQAFAEKIKKNNGAALVDLVSEDEMVEIESLKGEATRVVQARFICEILEARSEETLGLILRKLNDEDILSNLKNGIVLTGGGCQLPGLPELGEFTFDIPFRRGGVRDVLSTNTLAQSPGLSTVIGLLQHARDRQSFESSEFSLDTFKGSWGKIKNFFENIL